MISRGQQRQQSKPSPAAGSELHLQPISEYVHVLRKALPSDVFQQAPGRLLWLVLHVAVAATGIAVIGRGWGGWPLALGLSLVIGHSFASCAFVAHETLHGAIVRGRFMRRLVGWVSFLPFMLSPALWVAWHNKTHHGNTAKPGIDPDSFPTVDQYRASRLIRIVNRVTIGRRRIAGVMTLLIGFTVQSAAILVRARTALGLSASEHGLAMLETAAGVTLWTVVAILLGPLGFLFAFVIPLIVGNVIVMAYILTNHSLSPLTDVNDPLANSLSVTAPRVIEVLHLNFGFHVEHHLLPAMCSRHARTVRRVIREYWPERYQSMSIFGALRRLFATGRVYLDSVTLVDPITDHRTETTLLPRG